MEINGREHSESFALLQALNIFLQRNGNRLSFGAVITQRFGQLNQFIVELEICGHDCLAEITESALNIITVLFYARQYEECKQQIQRSIKSNTCPAVDAWGKVALQ